MDERLAVINCRQLVTLGGPPCPRTGAAMNDLAIIEDGAMLVSGGRIERVGRRDEIEPMIPAGCEVFDAGLGVVTPGFVDAHTHPVFAGSRADEFEKRAAGHSYQEIAAAGGGIQATVRSTRAASEDELTATGRRYAEWFLRAGTTTVEAKSGYGLSVDDELKILRVIRRLNSETSLEYVPTFLGAHSVPLEFAGRREEYVSLVIDEMLPRVAAERLAEYCDVFCEAGYFDQSQTRRTLEAARTLGLRPRLHADQLTRSGGAELAAALNAVTADHLEQTDQAGIEALRAAGVQPVLLPASVLLLGSHRYPEARAMIDAGLAVVLATDFNPGSSPTVSMGLVMSLAVTQMGMTLAEAMTAATINGAWSLGRGDVLGSLESGKKANFVIHDIADWRELAYFTGIEHSKVVFVNGQNCLERTVRLHKSIR